MIRKITTAALLGVVLLLGACGGGKLTPAQSVYAGTASFNVALTAAVAYATLPRCQPEGGPTLCSRADVVQKMNASAIKAWAALQEAQVAARADKPDAERVRAASNIADLAVAELRALTPKPENSP